MVIRENFSGRICLEWVDSLKPVIVSGTGDVPFPLRH